MQLLEQHENLFQAWPKIPRLVNEQITVTEKMDGTNACIIIEDGVIIGIQSRKRLIYPEGWAGQKGCDNHGFAGWVEDNETELLKLGDGRHYGEWCGPGINGNKHKLSTKRFYLFNVGRWDNDTRPSCCDLVRVLYSGSVGGDIGNPITRVEFFLSLLKTLADNEGYTPEGVIIYNHLSKCYYKATYDNPEGKWNAIQQQTS